MTNENDNKTATPASKVFIPGEQKENRQGSLFANEPLNDYLQVAKVYMDSAHDTENILTKEKIEKAVKYEDYKVEEVLNAGTKKQRELGLEMIREIDIEKLKNLPPKEIRSYFAEQFVSFVKVLTDPVSKKYYLALWKMAGKRGMPIFTGQKLTDLIKEATGKNTNQIRQRDRQLATRCLLAWNRIQLKIMEGYNRQPFNKGGKKLVKIEKTYKYTKLFNMTKGVEAEVIDGQGKIIETATIKKIYGNLPFETQGIGAYIPENILMLTGDEGERIDLALEIWKKANQKNKSRLLPGTGKYKTPEFNQKIISLTRAEWIKLAGKTSTDKTKKSVASERLLGDFQRLKQLGIIASYPEKVGTDDNEIIAITLKDTPV